MNVRSTLLIKMPPLYEDSFLWRKKFIRRLTLLLFLFLAFVGLTYALRQKLIPQQAPFDWLYRIHDDGYLVLKGYIFSLYYPISLIWIVLAFILISIVTVSWLIQRSAVRAFHNRMVRSAVRNPARHTGLIRGAKTFRVFTGPNILVWITYNEYERTLLAVRQTKLGNARLADCQRLLDLLKLHLQLFDFRVKQDPFYTGNDPDTRALWRLERTLGALATVWLHGQESAKKTVIPQLIALVKTYLPSGDDTGVNTSPERSFLPDVLRTDIMTLIVLMGLGSGDSAEVERLQLTAKLYESLSVRIRVLHKACSALQFNAFRRSNLRDIPLLEGASEASFAPLGAIALHIFLLAQEPRLLQAYIDALDSLSLLLQAAPTKSTEHNRFLLLFKRPIKASVYPYIPLPAAQYDLAQMQEALLAEQQAEWAFLWEQHRGTLSGREFELAQTLNVLTHNQVSGMEN